MNRNILIFLVLVVILGGWIGYKIYNKPHQDLTRMKPDYALTSAALLQEFEANEETAQNKFLNKIIRIEGNLSEIQQIDQKLILIIDTGNPLSNIQCEMDPRYTKSEKVFTAGQKVTVQGICAGKLMDIVLSQVVEVQ